MLHGCDGVTAALPLSSLVIGANYLPNTTFSKKLFNAISVIDYIGFAVSVQTQSGIILGCGRLETVFPVDASYQGKNTFNQPSRFSPASVVDASNDNILQYHILDGIAGTCSSKAATFDPWGGPGLQVPDGERTSDLFPVGDLPNHRLEVFSLLPEVPLIGSASILGHAVSMHHEYMLYTFLHKYYYIIKL